jgi:hypothetical protein
MSITKRSLWIIGILSVILLISLLYVMERIEQDKFEDLSKYMYELEVEDPLVVISYDYTYIRAEFRFIAYCNACFSYDS